MGDWDELGAKFQQHVGGDDYGLSIDDARRLETRDPIHISAIRADAINIAHHDPTGRESYPFRFR